jgi:parvulin-like peptidyl-prolyl isomerase
MKTVKRGICLFLATLLCVGLLAACGGGETPAPEETPTEVEATPAETPAPEETPEPAAPVAFDGTWAGIAVDTVVIDMDIRPVLWGEFFYDLQSYRGFLESWELVTDWDAVFEGHEEGLTFGEAALAHAVTMALQRRAIETIFTETLGETLEEGFYEEVLESIMAGNAMNEAELEALMHANFLTDDVFRYISEVTAMQEAVLAGLFGEGGEDVPQAEIDDFVAAESLLRARHILLSTRNEINQDIPEQERAVVTAHAIALYEELQSLSGAAQIARFDEMLAAYGEDPGMLANPTGYTFGPGVMVEEFTAGTLALALNEIGPPVASFFGYHIILRLPVERDALVMQWNETVQSAVARQALDREVEAAKADLVYERMPIFAELVPSEIFARVA